MNAIYDFLDNRLSPTLVRDIRQLTRNRFITVMLNLYVLILTIGTLMTLIVQSAQMKLEGYGEWLYGFDLIFFFIFTFIVVNLYTAVMLSQERITNDLMFTTTIPPSGFVFGKLSSALVLTGLLFCVTLPFFTIAYMLRGIDLRTILQSGFLVILMLGLSLSMTILIFSRVKTYVMMIGLLILYAFLCFMGVISFVQILFEFFGWGWRGSVAGDEWWPLIFIGVFVVMTALVILSAAMSRVASTNTNRIMPFRITYTAYMLLTLAGAFFFANFITGFSVPGIVFSPTDLLPIMVTYHYGFFLVLIVISTCGRDHWGLRIKRTIPNNPLLRFLLFPFYSGAINGIVWLLGIAAVLIGSMFWAAVLRKSSSDQVYNILLYGGTWAIMTYAFCTLAMMLRIRLLRRHLAPEHTWILALAMIGTFFSIYFLIRFLLYFDRTQYGFYVDDITIEQTLFIACLWGALATALFIPWAIRQLPNFSPEIIQSRDSNRVEKSDTHTSETRTK